jgi:hypothetical protein
LVGLTGTLVRLRDSAGAETVISATQLQSSAGFAVIGAETVPRLEGLGLLAGVPADALVKARWWEQHIVELETGHLPGSGQQKPQYDPAQTNLEQREQAKLEQLAAAGMAVSLSTLKRRRRAYGQAGLWGLVDHRATRVTSPIGRADDRLVDAVRVALNEQISTSSGTRSRLRRRVEVLLAEQYGAGVVPCRRRRPSTDWWPCWNVAAMRSGRLRPGGPWRTGRTGRSGR